MTYTKLFASIITSSIWGEDDQTRITWITMLALANKHGEVFASVPGLARIAAVSVESCQRAITKFLAPDTSSRSPERDGCRIEPIRGGWLIINYEYYREMSNAEDIKSQAAIRAKRYRDRKRNNNGASDLP